MSETFLHDVLVVELGDRECASGAGSLLSELGAMVVFVEWPDSANRGHKWADRARAAAGKECLCIDLVTPADQDLLRELVARADIVLTSTDVDSPMDCMLDAIGARALHCDFTAFGNSGPMRGHAFSDPLIQAFSGAMMVTGNPDSAPTLSRCRFIDGATAAIGASSALTGLRIRRSTGRGQRVDIAMLDVAISMNATFLSQYFSGIEPRRIGNRHVSMSPWNAYRTVDGWVLMCTGSNDQWKRVCTVIERPELVSHPSYDSPRKRVSNREALDEVIEGWTRMRPTSDCIRVFNKQQLPCGPVYALADLQDDPSLAARGMLNKVDDPVARRERLMAGSAFRANRSRARPRRSIQLPDGGRASVRQNLAARVTLPAPPPGRPISGLPLQGLRVLEIGSYTTAPSCTRHLGALGADIVKVEPPGGDPGRALPPLRDNQGVFFSISNSDKRSISLDFRQENDLAVFRDLLREADVFVENLRPGALVQFSLGPDDLLAINPRLIYCSITGFGIHSPFAERGAMDTTIQAMSGIMDLTTGSDGMPVKVGISVADAAGGQYGLLCVLAALEAREANGRGQWIDLSMQDISVQLTEGNWMEGVPMPTIVQCSDGWIVVDASVQETAAVLQVSLPAEGSTGCVVCHLSRSSATQELARLPYHFTCVHSVGEAMENDQVRARGIVVSADDAVGRSWQLLASPLRLLETPPVVRSAIGPLGSDMGAVLREWLHRP